MARGLSEKTGGVRAREKQRYRCIRCLQRRILSPLSYKARVLVSGLAQLLRSVTRAFARCSIHPLMGGSNAHSTEGPRTEPAPIALSRPARVPRLTDSAQHGTGSMRAVQLGVAPKHIVQAGTRTPGASSGVETGWVRKGRCRRVRPGWAAQCHETSKKGRGHARKPTALRTGSRGSALAMHENRTESPNLVDRRRSTAAPHTDHAQTALSRPTRAPYRANDALLASL